jgi:hypothetical protein
MAPYTIDAASDINPNVLFITAHSMIRHAWIHLSRVLFLWILFIYNILVRNEYFYISIVYFNKYDKNIFYIQPCKTQHVKGLHMCQIKKWKEVRNGRSTAGYTTMTNSGYSLVSYRILTSIKCFSNSVTQLFPSTHHVWHWLSRSPASKIVALPLKK